MRVPHTMRDKLKNLFGLPPYNMPENTCWNDGYYARSLEREYGKSIEELAKEAGIQRPRS